MTILKQLFLIFTTICLVVIGLTTSPVSAQSQQQLMVAVTPYSEGQSLDFFFLNSTNTLHYIEAADNPVFVSIITPEQKKEYEKAGYKPQIIDDHAGSIDQYYIMSASRHAHINEASQLQKPEYKQQGLELAYQLTKKTTLLKVAPGKSLSQLDIPGIHHARQLHRNLVPPTGRTSVEVQQAFSPAAQPTTETPVKDAPTSMDPKWILVLILNIALAIIIFLILRKKSHVKGK